MSIDDLAKPFLRDLVPYTPGKPIEQLAREQGKTLSIAKLASNENPYPPAERIRNAMVKAMESANRYPESGAPELTENLAARHRLEPDEIFVGHGTNEILDLLVRAYVNPDENCVFSGLSFIIYKLICKQCGVGFVEVPAKDYTHDLTAMAHAIDDGTRLVFVCNPNNPTATYNTARELGEFLADVPDDVLVVLDEAYFEFVTASDYPDSISLRKSHENLIIMRTLSKYYSLAGVRVGYAIADRRVTGILHKMRQPFNVSRLAQAAAEAALECTEDLKWYFDETIREREAMRKAILRTGCACPPSQTNFLFVIPCSPSIDVCEKLEAEGIIVRPMPLPGVPQNAFRVNTGTPEENQRFIAAFQHVLSQAT